MHAILSRYLGCLFGLAIGDALGAPVEFLILSQIRKEYGQTGIADFHEYRGLKPGSYTDDTQMALATAQGCIEYGLNKQHKDPIDPTLFVYHEYLRWLGTQDDPFQRRTPGNTCLSALKSNRMGSISKRINNSKGCGGVMRTAPAGLAFPSGEAFKWGAEFAAITHGHPSGYLPAGFLSELIAWIMGGKSLSESIDLTLLELVKYDGYEETLDKVRQALKLADSVRGVDDSIKMIGEGWVGEEALTISLYCALRFQDDFRSAVLAAVNHSGDSDSTGSITGAILGTYLGIDAIPEKWVKGVENSDMIRKTAEDPFKIFQSSARKVR